MVQSDKDRGSCLSFPYGFRRHSHCFDRKRKTKQKKPWILSVPSLKIRSCCFQRQFSKGRCLYRENPQTCQHPHSDVISRPCQHSQRTVCSPPTLAIGGVSHGKGWEGSARTDLCNEEPKQSFRVVKPPSAKLNHH